MCKYLKLPLLLFVFVSSICGHAQLSTQLSNWQQMNGNFTSMCVVPNKPSIVYIGDNSGLIRKSTDKGTTWKRVYRTGIPVTDIQFLNEQTGFAVSNYSNGLIFCTSDGGNTWLRKQIYDSAEPTNTMRFSSFKKIIPINNQTAIFELTENGSKGMKEIITTRDDGKTFNIELSPDNLFHVGGDTLIAFGFEIDMFNLKKMKISKSFNRGLTWISASSLPNGVTTALNVYGVGYAYFINKNEFYFTASSSSSDKTLYKSTDGGATITVANKPGGINDRVLWMHYKDSKNGIMITSAATSSFQRTTNSGTTWTGISGLNPMLPITQIEGDELLASNTNRCMRTTNYGANWNNLSENIYQVSITNTIPSYVFLNTVTHNTFYASLSALWGGSFYGKTLVRTNDEGLTWNNVTNNSNVKYERESFHFSSPDTMLFIQNYAINRSTDGGKTSKVISPINFGGSGNAIATFSFVRSNKKYGVAYAILGGPNFWLTKDGGNTWAKTTGTTPYLSVIKLQLVASDTWYMLASENNKAAVYKSTDEGKNWNKITGIISISTNPEIFDAAGMSFANKTTGYVFGPQGTLYKTTDGGTTWTSIKTELPQSAKYNNFSNMAFRTEKEGYLHPGVIVKDNKTWGIGTTGLKMEFSNDTTLGAMMDNYGNFYKYFPNSTISNEKVIASKITGIDQAKTVSAQITAYPNPTHNELHIDAKGKSLTVSIIDLMGKTHRTEIIHNHAVISVRDLPNGIYFIKTSKNNEYQVLKFLKY